LRGDIYIDVYTNVNSTTINAVDREQKKVFATDVGIIAQNYAMAKTAGFDLETVLPIKDVLRDLAA